MNSKIGKFCNCTKKDECPSPGDNYECCSEMVPGGSPARFGLWVENKTCDPSKGIPKDAHLEKEKYTTRHSHSRTSGTVEGYNCSKSKQAPEETYYSPESYPQQGYSQQAHPRKVAQEGYYSPESYHQQEYSQRTSSTRSCPKKPQQMYSRKSYTNSPYTNSPYSNSSYTNSPYTNSPYTNSPYSRRGYYYEDEDEDEYDDEEEEEEDPCGDLRNGFNILLWILIISVIVSGVYYLKSKKPKEK